MRKVEPEDDWIEEPECPECSVELRNYGRYLHCPDCGDMWKRVLVEEQYRPMSE